MNKIIDGLAEHIGDAVASGVRKTLGGSDKDEKDEKKGGFLSFWGGGEKDDKDKDEGGLFSFGDKKKDDDKGGFFSKIFDKDDDNDKPKKSGFQGLFSEQEGASGGEATPTFEEVGDVEGRGAGVSDGDVFNDLMDVANEMSRGE